jgi:23S rRNA pseudouridine955/2504/2580 synthase/23S rRNA pseudouridine1911/1915/1917 synthase
MRWKLEHILQKEGGGILFEDESIIAVNKPAGMLVLPDRYDRKLHNLYDLLKEALGNIYTVHRIDRETSGVVLFAKTLEMHSAINTLFETRQIKKVYQAIVVGTPAAEEGEIHLPLAETDHGAKKIKVDTKRGKESLTKYKILERFKGFALLEIYPYTGRTHQIRVHLSAVGIPILSDSMYGSGGGFFLSSIKRNFQTKREEKPLLARTALHASSLSFNYAERNGMLSFQAPIPKDMEVVLKSLRKYQKR